MTREEAAFAALVAGKAAQVPGVLAVTLGGSRAQGRHHPDSDWDFGLYYRGRIDPDDVRALGWPGQVFAPGAWGGGVMNGGAWLEIEGRRVDLIYRDLDEVEHWLAEARQGRFEVQRLLFHLAGIPTYVVGAELAVNLVLSGSLPRPAFPEALRRSAPIRWREEARLTLAYADRNYARRGDAAGCAGLLSQAVLQAAHARVASRGIWVLNEKHLVELAGLGAVGARFATLGGTPEALRAAVRSLAEELLDAPG